MTDKYTTTDGQWYTPEALKYERERAEKALEEMKHLEKKFKRTLVTTALPYANGPVHIGHLAGVYVPADIYTRYLRLKGEDVVMIGGSDEHGVPITIKAKTEGVTPQDIVDRYHKNHQRII